jgi:multidrug resistance efflux pump
MLDEELSSESYRQRVLAAELAATDRSRAYTAEEQAAQEMAAAARADAAVGERLASLERLRSLAQEHGLINADGVITAKLEEAVGLRLVRAEPAEGEGVKIEVGLPFPEPPSA